jgi:hypothetical protein
VVDAWRPSPVGSSIAVRLVVCTSLFVLTLRAPASTFLPLDIEE